MKKTLTKILSVMLIVCITLTSAPLSGLVGLELPEWLGLAVNASSDETTVTAGYWSDSGNYDTSWYYKNQYASVYTLNSAEELAGLSVLVNNGKNFAYKTIKLGSDINLYDHYWTPIGKFASKDNSKYFSGTFDGQGHTISFLMASGDYSALFSCVSNGAIIKNILFDNIALSGINYVAGVVAYADADNGTVYIENCHINSGKIRDDIIAEDYDWSQYTAGIVAYLSAIDGEASIINCTNRVDIVCDDYGAGIVGCAIGYKEYGETIDKNIVITNCHNYGYVYSGENTQYCGGVAGFATKSIFSECANYKDVIGDSTSDDDGSLWYSGICGNGRNNGFVNCANYGKIKSWVVSGISIGSSNTKFINCLNTGEMDHISLPDGEGHALSRYGTFENCYYLSGSGFAPGYGYGSSTPNNIGSTSTSLNSLKSGAICFKLNNSTASGEVVWGQNIDNGEIIQEYPVIGGAKVYYIDGKYTNAPDHTFDKGVVTREPTCSEYGVLTFTCQDCEFTFDESIKMVEHNYDNGVITKEPTGAYYGEKTYTCVDCGYAYTEMACYPYGHKYGDSVITIKPTCTQNGEEEFTCLECGWKKIKTISSHNYDDGIVTTAPTCTQNGITTFTCIDCGNTKTSSISETGHSYDDGIVTKERTCTEDGNIRYTCTICDDSYDSTIYRYYHSYNYNNYTVTKDPTCTETGIKTYACVRCKQTTTSTISTLPHNYDIGIITKKATCTSDGTKKYTCSDCGSTKTETIKAYNHINNVLIDSSYYPESNHVYYDNLDDSKTFTWKGALNLKVKFSSDTLVEYDYDEIVLYNDYGKELGRYTGDELAGKTITISGDSFAIKLISDFAVTKFGYSIDSIVAEMSCFDEWKVVMDPTCSDSGLEKRTCSLCGNDETNELSALNHINQYIIDSSYYPESEHLYATSMDESKIFTWTGAESLILKFSTKTKLSKWDSDYICLYDGSGTQIGKFEDSSLSGKIITIPGDTFTIRLVTSRYSDTEYGYSFDYIIAQNGAISDWTIVKEPTCAETGQITRNCSLCDFEENDILSKTNHTEVEIPEILPTCTDIGFTTGVKCSVCDEILESQQEIPALGHDIITDEAVAPDCINTGLTAGEHCSRCDYKVEQTVVDALGHKYESVVTAPTCTSQGFTTYTCHCGDTYTSDYVDALGHTDSEIVEENYIAPTCTANGSKDNVTYCTVCSAETSRETITIPALGHTEEEIPAVAPNCTETGLTTGVKCLVCDEILEPQQKLPALGHDIITDEAVAPDCTNTGLTAGEHCSRCDYKVEQTAVDALGHKYESVATAPTCTTQGFTTYTCSVCGDTYISDYVDALGHTAGDIIEENYIASTCTETGSKDNVTYCTVCNTETSRETISIPALGHTEEEIPAIAPTCTETGLTTGVKCSVCDEILEPQQEIAALGHDIITDEAVAPDCTNTGLTAGEHCSRCDYKVEQTEVDALGHKYESVVTAPTCTSQGFTTYTCHCGDTYTSDYVDASGHNYKDGICADCDTPDPAYFTFEIQKPSTTTIRCKDGIKLHAKTTGKLPDGARIEWSADNGNFDVNASASGNEITIISTNNGYTTFTATVYDADNNVIAQDTIEMYSKAGLFDKIGGFFRSLFGSTRIYEN